jgi:signal transduction histidine kinase/purine-cytosine permease-like protein/ActR/RegA family two-component response regulator
LDTAATQRIVKIRRDYNTWVANETMEDYSLRFTPRSFRKWSEFKVANTALGAVSFLALEAIGGSITLNYGFINAFWAILAVGLVIFLTGLPISYYAAKYGVDMDLLTRGAGFGYIGSTITSLIYASFTFIFFALEAAIMALALELYFDIPLSIGYLASSLVIIPMVLYGITMISRLQLWTQPVWLVLLVLPYAFVLFKEPDAIRNFTTFAGRAENGGHFDLLLFGAAAAVAFSLVAQIGEQVDFLRFLPERTRANRTKWWAAMLSAGPGWILPGVAKMLGGAFLAFLALQHEVSVDKAVEPTQMYLIGFQYVFTPEFALAATALFVIVSQVKINVTNAYAGSLAWSNFFARLTHNHPGRVVWLVFNVLIAVVLMELGVFKALEHVLGLYSNVAIAWVGALVADLVVNKPLGLSPRHIEFKRAHLFDVNPVGTGAMLIASALSILAFSGAFGAHAQAFAPFIALIVAFVSAPLLAWWTRGRYYIARSGPVMAQGPGVQRCCICHNEFEREDMAFCPAYGDPICSLCCSLDARCQDRCKSAAPYAGKVLSALQRFLPAHLPFPVPARIGNYLAVLSLMTLLLAAVLALVYYQESMVLAETAPALKQDLGVAFLKLFAVLMLFAAVGSWWIVLSNETRHVAQEESNRQTHLLMREIEAHRLTDAKLQKAKEAAEAANLAKSRYVTGMSHELRTPLNSILGYAQILQKDPSIPENRHDAIAVIRRSGEHLVSLIDGLLDIARIEAGKLRLDHGELRLAEFLDQIVKMFRPQAAEKGIEFRFECLGKLPEVVHADERRLRQILINLLGNAVKFTDSGSVTLRASYLREMARFEIEDTGIGIGEADLGRIFLPFERGGEADGKGKAGTGLGLAISRMLTDLMGGEMQVRSQPGRGSVFQVRVYLPAVTSPKTLARAESDIAGYSGPRKRVLVVDDQASQRQPLIELLGMLGFEVRAADSGEACLRIAPGFAPDIVLMDIAMPGLDGWEVSRLLRASEAVRVPIVMVSANAHDNDPEKRLRAGCDDFLVKPVIATELLNKLQTHLGLEWIYRVALPPVPAAERMAATEVPSEEQIRDLRTLGDIGYVRGILDKLDEIERADNRYAAFVRRLRSRVQGFRLEEYSRLLTRLTSHDASKR